MVPSPQDRSASPGEVVRSLAFYVAFYGGSVLFVSASTLSLMLPQVFLHAIARGWSIWHQVCCRVLLGIKVEAHGFTPRTGVLYAIKHESFFEAIDLPRQYGLPVVFAKEELLHIPLWGKTGRHFGLIGVDRTAGASALRRMVSEARRRVADGRPLVIFPEGTRVPHGTLRPLQSGFAGIYKLLRLPVIPVAVDGGPLYHRLWKRKGTIRYVYGEEIPAGLEREDIEARVHTAINALNHG